MKQKINFSSLENSYLDQANSQDYAKNFKKGLSEEIVRSISQDKDEPQWVLDIRLKALQKFHELDMPSWAPNTENLDLSKIRYFSKATDKTHAKTWDDVDPEIKATFEKLKIPEAEQAILAGVGAQYESENIYHKLKDEYSDMGIIFEDLDIAIKKHPDLVKKYLTKCVPINDHKYSALHYAVFSGGTFLYIPKNVEIDLPLQSYFRMNSENQGQFEHTLLVIEKGAKGHYIEGCSAPKFGSESLHAGCVEIFVTEEADFRYSSVENWSKDTFNLNTKRAIVQKNAQMEWVSGNLGSGLTMLYPCTMLIGDNSRANHLGIAFANTEQNQDTGTKVIISGQNCRANILAKSLSKGGGINTYRGIVDIKKTANKTVVSVNCDGLIMDDKSVADTIPKIKNTNSSSQVVHEASVGKISDEVLLYFESRGINEETALGMIVNGFLDEVVKTLPLEFAGELNRLIELEIEGGI
jgi:Fe-S cluster assembly protein SufB